METLREPPVVLESKPLENPEEVESRRLMEENIISALNDNNIIRIGIDGAVGIGKSKMVRRISEKVKREKLFKVVVMVTVGPSSDLNQVAYEISDYLSVKVEVGDYVARANELLSRLIVKERVLIILDDVREILNLEKIEPLEKLNGSYKIIITSRFKSVCLAMGCDLIFTVQEWTLKDLSSFVSVGKKYGLGRSGAPRYSRLLIAATASGGTLEPNSRLRPVFVAGENLQKKIVVRVPMNDRSKALKISSGISGVESVALSESEKDQLVVVGGNDIDAVVLAQQLRKNLGYSEIVSVSEDKKEAPAAPKVEVLIPQPAVVGSYAPPYNCDPCYTVREMTVPPSQDGMKFFRTAKAVRLQSYNGRYLVAAKDKASVHLSHIGVSYNARWIVEFVEGKRNKIRLKSCHGLYLTATNELINVRALWRNFGRKVLQTLPEKKTDVAIEWEPVREGLHVKLMTSDGSFLIAIPGLLWGNSVCHNEWQGVFALWEVDNLDISYPNSGQIRLYNSKYGNMSKEQNTMTKEVVDSTINQNTMTKEVEDSTINQNTMTKEVVVDSTINQNTMTKEVVVDSTINQNTMTKEVVDSTINQNTMTKEVVVDSPDFTLFCSMFPSDYEFTRDILVWQWIAGGLTKMTDDETMENACLERFDTLLSMNYIVPSGYDHLVDQTKYKLGDKMISFLQEQQLEPTFRKHLDSRQSDVAQVQHLSLAFEQSDGIEFEALKRYSHLQSMVINHCYGSKVKYLPFDLFLELKDLKILNLSRTGIVALPSSVENLKELRFLDVSETPISWLPETIRCFSSLQTLKLDGCLSIRRLPKCTNELINLRQLVLDVARQLQSMPVGIGKLSKLQTLTAYLVGEDDGCRIGELKDMNKLRGSLRIMNLENVETKEEAEEACLFNKLGLKKLELQWSDLQDEKHMVEEGVLESLQPPFGIHELKILFYSGGVFPSWISNPLFGELVKIILYRCRYCCSLPSLGELPSLKHLTIIENNEVTEIGSSFCRNGVFDHQQRVAFPSLEKLSFDSMSKLEKWTGLENGDFPSLRHLVIEDCPKFASLPILWHLTTLLHLEISYCPELSCLPEGGLPSTLESLMVKDCPKLAERYCDEDWPEVARVPGFYINNKKVCSSSD